MSALLSPIEWLLLEIINLILMMHIVWNLLANDGFYRACAIVLLNLILMMMVGVNIISRDITVIKRHELIITLLVSTFMLSIMPVIITAGYSYVMDEPKHDFSEPNYDLHNAIAVGMIVVAYLGVGFYTGNLNLND